MAWNGRAWVNGNLIGLLAVLGIVLAAWLLWQWLLVAVAIAVPCVLVLLWVSRPGRKRDPQGGLEIRRRRERARRRGRWTHGGRRG